MKTISNSIIFPYIEQNVLGRALTHFKSPVFSLKCTAWRYYDGVLGALEQTKVKCLAQGSAILKTSMSKGHYPTNPSKDEKSAILQLLESIAKHWGSYTSLLSRQRFPLITLTTITTVFKLRHIKHRGTQ